MFDINDIGLIKVKKEERDRVKALRVRYPEARLFRVRINNQEAQDGKEPVTGCLNGDEFIIPREQDWICPLGHLGVLRDAVFQDMRMEETTEKGFSEYYRVHSQRQRYHLMVYGELDLKALDKELAAESAKAAKAAQKSASGQEPDPAENPVTEADMVGA